MAMGSALVSGYRQGQPDKRRSLMPAINTLGNMVRSRRAAASRGGGRRFITSEGESGTDRRSREREERHDLEELKAEEKNRYERDQAAQAQAQSKAGELVESEEGRRQETHDVGMERSAMESERGQVTAGREDKTYARKEAYQAIKTGMMMQDPDMIRQGFEGMVPVGEDEITYETLADGTRKVTGRPPAAEVPEFIFHPDGFVGVTFPGQSKPVVFQNVEDAFKNVIAPMNPDRWDTKPGTAKDKVTSAKNEREAAFKEKKLQAEVHGDAHEAAMAQFEADGYYQPALYNEDKYWDAYNSYVERATGTPPRIERGAKGVKGAEDGSPEQYKGDEAPEGFPGARRGPRGGWYVQKKGKWFPILKGKESSPVAPEQPGPGGRKPMPQTAGVEAEDIQASGVTLPAGKKPKKAKKATTADQQARIKETGIRPRKKVRAKGKKKGEGELYRGTAPPKDYPDAQFDRDEGIWYYFDSATQKWEKVTA